MTKEQKEILKKLVIGAEEVSNELFGLFGVLEGDACENEDELLSSIASRIEQASEDVSEAVQGLKELCE